MGYAIGGLVAFLVLAANVGLGWAIAIVVIGFAAMLGLGFVGKVAGWDTGPGQAQSRPGPRHIRVIDVVHHSQDFYELVVAKHDSSSLVITSNRKFEEWLSLFANLILGNGSPDR